MTDLLRSLPIGVDVKRATARRSRLRDSAAAVVALLLVAPVLLVVGVLVRMDSGGPVLVRQPRLGPRGRYSAVSFRTVHAEAGLTRLGGVLRRSGVEVLPRLWNVVTGDMRLASMRHPV